MIGKVTEISYKEAVGFLLPKHYSGRIPSITKAFGWFINDDLSAVCTFGKPASPYLCSGICGESNKQHVYELNRLCRTDDCSYPLSHFVSMCLKKLKTLNWIIVSYSDTQMHHCGYIYQACNFIYTGETKSRTDIYVGGRLHSRHYNTEKQNDYLRIFRSSKHRYIYFCTNDRKLKRQWENQLRYERKPYPKEKNENYSLGNYIRPVLVNKNRQRLSPQFTEYILTMNRSDWLDKILDE